MPRPQRSRYQPARMFSEYSRREAYERYCADLQEYDRAHIYRTHKRVSRRVNRYEKALRERGMCQ